MLTSPVTTAAAAAALALGTLVLQRWGSGRGVGAVVADGKTRAGCARRFVEAKDDIFGGVEAQITRRWGTEAQVEAELRACIRDWKASGKRHVWMQVPAAVAERVGVCIRSGLQLHHAEKEYVMLVGWFSKSQSNNLPPNATHSVGVGSIVLDERNNILVVQERLGPTAGKDIWKYPTGLVEQNEDLASAARREVKEETGIDCEFVGVIAFRHNLIGIPVTGNKSDLFFLVLMRPLSYAIKIQEQELSDARWMQLDEYMERFSKFVPPGSTYHELSRLAAGCVPATKISNGENSDGVISENEDASNITTRLLEARELDVGFRPGTCWVYNAPQD